jgi:hypothetical protein
LLIFAGIPRIAAFISRHFCDRRRKDAGFCHERLPPMSERPAPRRRNAGRLLGHIAVAIVILAVIAAAFALSYNPVRDIARDAGVANYLVRIYPGILDAVFLVTCGCALMLRGARWWTRLFAWLSVLVTGALIGAADVYHVDGLRLPRRTLDGTVWALPWALILLAFSLWVSTLQHSKASRDATPAPVDQPAPDPQLALVAPQPTRALPAADLARAGGLSDVGFGQRPAMENPENVAGAAVPHKAAESQVAGEAEPAAADAEPVAADAEPAGADAEPTTAEAEPAEEPEWPFEAEEPSTTEHADGTAAAAGTREPAEDDTPAYGFPAVTEQDAGDEAPRMPTLLGAPVPAELPVDEAELSHDHHPGQDAAEDTQTPPGQPAHFERVRSTPTPPVQG